MILLGLVGLAGFGRKKFSQKNIATLLKFFVMLKYVFSINEKAKPSVRKGRKATGVKLDSWLASLESVDKK